MCTGINRPVALERLGMAQDERHRRLKQRMRIHDDRRLPSAASRPISQIRGPYRRVRRHDASSRRVVIVRRRVASLDWLTTTPATVNSLSELRVRASCVRSVLPSDTTTSNASTRGPTSSASSVTLTGGRSIRTKASGERRRMCESNSLNRVPASSSDGPLPESSARNDQIWKRRLKEHILRLRLPAK